MTGGSENSTSHSCVVVWDAPQAFENTTKMTTEVITVSFWPKISLNFDHLIKKPVSKSVLMRKDVHQFLSLSYRYTSTNVLSHSNYDARKPSVKHISTPISRALQSDFKQHRVQPPVEGESTGSQDQTTLPTKDRPYMGAGCALR